LDWDNLGFGLNPADYMYVMKCSKDGEFTQGELSPYGNIQLSEKSLSRRLVPGDEEEER
jgi:branched-chain amino acid aminotransferase